MVKNIYVNITLIFFYLKITSDKLMTKPNYDKRNYASKDNCKPTPKSVGG
jgi:hypothetical protein